MHLEKEDLEKKQDAVAGELCALLERAGRGGASSRVFEIPEFARRTIDISLSKGELTGHMKGLVINDWKRKDHDGGVPEERMAERDVLTGVALIMKKEGLQVFADANGKLYVLGTEPYGGIAVAGQDGKPLYQLYISNSTNEAREITSDGKPLRSYRAEMHGHTLTLKGWFRKRVLKPFDLSEQEFVSEMKKKSKGGK